MKIKPRFIRQGVNRVCGWFGVAHVAFPSIPPDNSVLFFSRDRADFPFLSNFYPCSVELDGTLWPNTEAYYQAQKSDNPEYRARILKRPEGRWSKKVGNSYLEDGQFPPKSWFRTHSEDLRTDWKSRKVEVMRRGLHAKFTQNENLRLALLNTGTAKLIEDSPNDSFWGLGEDGRGNNLLGKMLMELREELTS